MIRCEAKAVTSVETRAPVLVLVKEVHARPQRDGRFQEVSDPNQTDLQFEVFANCWLVSQASLPVATTELQLVLRKADGSAVGMERVSGDLQTWRLGRLKEDLDSEGLRYFRFAPDIDRRADIV